MGFRDLFSASAGGASGGKTGGVGLGVEGLTDPNFDSTEGLEKVDPKVWDPQAARPRDPVTTVAAVIVDPPKLESAPLPGFQMSAGQRGPAVDKTPVPSVDRLDPVKASGQADGQLFKKSDDLQRVGAAQSDRMAQLKANAGDMTKQTGLDPKAQASVDIGKPSAAGGALGLAMPSPVGLAAAAGAGYAFGPAMAAAVAAVDTAAGVFRVLQAASGPEAVAIKGQGTYSDARTQSPQYGYNGKPQDAFSYASAKPIEQLARPVSAPVVMDSGPQGRRLADDLWKPGQLASTGVRLGPDATRAAADEMASLRREMDKTGLYADRLRNFADAPLDMNRDNLTRAMTSGTEIKTDDLVNRQVLQVRPPQLNFA